MRKNDRIGENRSRVRKRFGLRGRRFTALLCAAALALVWLSGCAGTGGAAGTPETPGGDPIADTKIAEEDYSRFFGGIEGCAVLYDVSGDKWTFYNKEQCEAEASPCSTFKIVSALIGLKYGVVTSADSRMGYDGTRYPREAWNSDVTLKEAFDSSCVWYFKKIIDQVGPENMEKELKQLGYGNCDVSEWDGTAVNPLPDLNGFWIESSLSIAPREMVRVLSDLFEGKTDFSQEHLELVKSLMKQGLEQLGGAKTEGLEIYGKTGSGNRGDAWFAGMAETASGTTYFAVHLEDENAEGVNGARAREIAAAILNEHDR